MENWESNNRNSISPIENPHQIITNPLQSQYQVEVIKVTGNKEDANKDLGISDNFLSKEFSIPIEDESKPQKKNPSEKYKLEDPPKENEGKPYLNSASLEMENEEIDLPPTRDQPTRKKYDISEKTKEKLQDFSPEKKFEEDMDSKAKDMESGIPLPLMLKYQSESPVKADLPKTKVENFEETTKDAMQDSMAVPVKEKKRCNFNVCIFQTAKVLSGLMLVFFI